MRLMRSICRTCGAEVADTRTGTLLFCPQHPSALIDAVFVHDQEGPEIREAKEGRGGGPLSMYRLPSMWCWPCSRSSVAAQAIATLKDVSQDLCQGQQLHHKMMQAHDQMLTDHQAQMRQLTR